jgi:protein tyrosine/serine phosphatase
VVNLCQEDSDRQFLAGTGMTYERIPLDAWKSPAQADVARFLKIVTDKGRTPVFVHCRAGADRTGTLCAIYRIVVQGWTKQEAIDEMTRGGFGYHKSFDNLVEYLQELDVKALRREANAPDTTQPASSSAGPSQ